MSILGPHYLSNMYLFNMAICLLIVLFNLYLMRLLIWLDLGLAFSYLFSF